MSVGGCHEYSEGVQYTGGYHDECGGYHEHTGGCSAHWGFHTKSIVFPLTFPHIYHDIPQCTEHPHCTHNIPHITHVSPGVLKILRCTAVPVVLQSPLYCTYIMQGDKVTLDQRFTKPRNKESRSVLFPPSLLVSR